MKQFTYPLTAILVVFLSCCNQPQEQNESEEQAIVAHAHREVLPNLKLNNGKKWKVDEATNNNIIHMQQTVELYEVEKNKTFAGYLDAGKKLEADINKLVEECKMQGPDHDALHEWLHPFIEEAGSLSKAQNIEEAENYFEGVDAMLHKYHEFFEL